MSFHWQMTCSYIQVMQYTVKHNNTSPGPWWCIQSNRFTRKKSMCAKLNKRNYVKCTCANNADKPVSAVQTTRNHSHAHSRQCSNPICTSSGCGRNLDRPMERRTDALSGQTHWMQTFTSANMSWTKDWQHILMADKLGEQIQEFWHAGLFVNVNTFMKALSKRARAFSERWKPSAQVSLGHIAVYFIIIHSVTLQSPLVIPWMFVFRPDTENLRWFNKMCAINWFICNASAQGWTSPSIGL